MKRFVARVRPSCEAAVEEAFHRRALVVNTVGESAADAGEAATFTLTIACTPADLTAMPEPWAKACGNAVVTLDFNAKAQALTNSLLVRTPRG
jgi:hypothetical protein